MDSLRSAPAHTTARVLSWTWALFAAAAPLVAAQLPQCSLSEVERHHVRLGEAFAYVEPHFVERSRDHLLLLGHPTYLWDVGAERSAQIEANGFFGLLFRGDSLERIPAPPAPGTVGWSRTSRVAPDHVVTLFDVTDGAGSSVPYVADYEDGRWTRVQPLPMGVGGDFGSVALADHLRPLGTGGDVRFVATVLRLRQTILFERRDMVWHSRVVGGSGAAVSALSLDAERLAQAGWTDDQEDTEGILRVTDLTTGHSLARDLTGLPVGFQIYRVTWAPNGETVAVTVSSSRGWSIHIFPDGVDSDPISVPAAPRTLVPLRLPSGPSAFVVDAAPGTERRSISVLRPVAGRVEYASVPNPYFGPFAALPGWGTGAEEPEGAFTLIGPEARFDPESPFVRSLMIRMSFSCH